MQLLLVVHIPECHPQLLLVATRLVLWWDSGTWCVCFEIIVKMSQFCSRNFFKCHKLTLSWSFLVLVTLKCFFLVTICNSVALVWKCTCLCVYKVAEKPSIASSIANFLSHGRVCFSLRLLNSIMSLLFCTLLFSSHGLYTMLAIQLVNGVWWHSSF